MTHMVTHRDSSIPINSTPPTVGRHGHILCVYPWELGLQLTRGQQDHLGALFPGDKVSLNRGVPSVPFNGGQRWPYHLCTLTPASRVAAPCSDAKKRYPEGWN